MLISLAKLEAFHVSWRAHQVFPIFLIGSIVAVSGVGELIRVTYAPLPEPEETATAEILVPPARLSPSRLDVTPDWAPAFGVRRVEDNISSLVELAADEEQLPVTSENNYRLRGIILEGSHSLALIEGENGTEIIRAGEALSDGQTLIDIHQDGIVVGGPGGQAHIAFVEPNSSGSQGGSHIFVRSDRLGASPEGKNAAEGLASRGTLQTAHSRPPQLSPPRFFSMPN